MKRVGFILALLFGVVPAISFAKPHDGNFSLTLSKDQQAVYVIGFLDGVELGHRFSYLNLVFDKQQQECKSALDKSFQDSWNTYVKATTYGQVNDGLAVFYKNYRNRNIDVETAVHIVVYGIAGVSQKQIDELTELARRRVSTSE